MKYPNYKQWNVVCRQNDYKDNSDDYNKWGNHIEYYNSSDDNGDTDDIRGKISENVEE